ncbi:MAG TPA: TadE/TadG family type IV pilus assembly protein [Candidatus Limnocylindrales bacterium]|nr:TadE/TadG family type IV pilus assembly protein [Candidatus Limnocylindrales bacterium]
MSDFVVPQPSHVPASRSRRGQSLVEFALVLPMLLVLLLGIADFGRAFHAGITVEAAARDAAEAVAQEYLQLRRSPDPPTTADYDRLHEVAIDTVCEEADALPNFQTGGSNCVTPAVAVCIHDDPVELPGYSCPQQTAGVPTPQCSEISAPWPNQWAAGELPSVEVRTCYLFTTIIPLHDLSLPLATGLNIGEIYLQKDRSFTVADYGY